MPNPKIVFPAGDHFLSGIYKATFDGNYFYYGSSKNLSQRFSTWKGGFNRPTNHKISKIMATCKEVVFEILLYCDDYKQKEDELIKAHISDPLCLNVHPNAYSGKGAKFEKRPKVKLAEATSFPISITRTEGEWKFIDKRLKELGKKDLSAYIISEMHKIKMEFEKCSDCVTPAYGPRTEKRPHIPTIAIKEFNKVARFMGKPVSSVINELIIVPLLRQGKV